MSINSLLNPVARFLMAFIFVASGSGKAFVFEQTAAMMAGVGFPAARLFLVSAVLIEVFAGMALILGFYTRYAAFALIIFIIPATIVFHAPFIGDPVSGQEQIAHTLKNLAIIGGLLKFFADGGGPFSLDRRFERKEIVV